MVHFLLLWRFLFLAPLWDAAREARKRFRSFIVQLVSVELPGQHQQANRSFAGYCSGAASPKEYPAPAGQTGLRRHAKRETAPPARPVVCLLGNISSMAHLFGASLRWHRLILVKSEAHTSFGQQGGGGITKVRPYSRLHFSLTLACRLFIRLAKLTQRHLTRSRSECSASLR